MKKSILILLLFSSFAANAQVYQSQHSFGFEYKRLKIDSTLHIPTFCGVPTLRGSIVGNQGALAIDSCNKKLYFYDPKDSTWNIVASGGSDSSSYHTLTRIDDTTYTANRMNGTKDTIRIRGLNSKVNISAILVNVKDFGAVGNGTTVDTTAFQNAITVARATGKSIYVPSGNYNLPFTQSVELAGIPRFFGDNDTLNFSNMVKLNGVPIDSVTYPANTSNAVFTNTGTLSFVQSGVKMTKDSVGVVLSTSAGVKPGDILFFTSVTPSPFPQFTYYFAGQRATVDSFNTSTGMCYLHEKVFYNISNAYVWKNSYRPNIDFGEGCTLLAKQYNTIIGIKAVNSSLNAFGNYKYWGKAAISYTNSIGNATVNTYETYRPNNGNSYGISVADLSNVTVLNSNIKGGRACVASGGGDYWLANQSGGSTGFAAYPCTINVVGGTFAPNQREGYASIDAHGITRSMFISGNAILYAPLYTQAENVIANGFTVYSNSLSAINLANKDSTVGVYNFSNFTIYSKATGVPGAIALNGGVNTLSISNGDIIDSSTNGSVSIVFPYFKCDIDNLRVTELAGTPFYLNFYNNNTIINGLNITGGTFTPVAKNDSLSLVINNSSFKDVPQTGTFQNGISGLQAKVMKNITLNNVTATGNAKFGVDIGNNALEVHINGGRYADNGKGLTGATNQAGIRAFNVQNFWVNNVDFRSYLGTQAYGIEHYGYSTPAYLNVTNSNFKGNTTAAFFQSSSTINGILNDIDIDGSLMTSTFGSSIVKINSDTVATRAYARSIGGTGTGGTTTNAVTFNNAGAGASSPATFDGSAAKTISYNTLGAVPTTTTVNGHALSANLSIVFPDIAAGAIANNTTATTQATTDSSNKLATTAFVKQVSAGDTSNLKFQAPLKYDATDTTVKLDTANMPGLRPYKVYTAILMQSGTAAPTATVLENTTGYTFTYTYDNVGWYTLTCSGNIFSTPRHVYVVTQNEGWTPMALFEYDDDTINSITLHVRKTSDESSVNDSMNGATIEIRIY